MAALTNNVSVVIPAFNAARFIADAINSVLAQTYQCSECIIVDDGSTDDTMEIARSFKGSVRVLSQPNSGVAVARNNGVAATHSKLIAFLDADDVWLRSKLERQVALISATRAELCYTGMYRTDDQLRVLEVMPPPLSSEARWNTLSRRQPSVFLAQTGLITRKSFLDLGGFNERLSTAADYEFAVRVTARHEVCSLPEPLAFYRMHREQMHLDVRVLEKDIRAALVCLVEGGTIDATTTRLIGRKLEFDLGVHAFSQRHWKEVVSRLSKAKGEAPLLAYEFLMNRLKKKWSRNAHSR